MLFSALVACWCSELMNVSRFALAIRLVSTKKSPIRWRAAALAADLDT